MVYENELMNIPLLANLEAEELSSLASVVRKVEAKKGSHVVYADDVGNTLMFVSKGQVKVSLVGGDAREIVLALLDEGEFFGEMALLTGETRSADVVAITDSVIFVLAQEDFEHHILNNTGLTHALLKELALRLRSASSKIGDLALFDVYRRVAKTLKSIAVEKEKDGHTIYLVEKRPTHQELAAMVGTSREMVTRALKSLEREECIKIDGKQIELLMLPL